MKLDKSKSHELSELAKVMIRAIDTFSDFEQLDITLPKVMKYMKLLNTFAV